MIDNNFSNNFPPNTDPRFPSPLPPTQPSTPPIPPIPPIPATNFNQPASNPTQPQYPPLNQQPIVNPSPTIPNTLPPLPTTPLPPQNLNQTPYIQPQPIPSNPAPTLTQPIPGYPPQPIPQSYPSTPNVSSPNSYQAPPPAYQPLANSIQNDVQVTEEQETPGIIKTISVLQFLVALLYAGSALLYLAIIILLDKSMGSGIGATFSFVKYFPMFGFVPVVISLASIWFFFVAFKVRSSNKAGFWITSASLIAVPVIAFVCQQLVTPFLSLASGASKSVMPINPHSLRFNDPIFVLEFIILILLIISYKKFDLNGTTLSTKAKVFLAIVTIIFVLPVNATMAVKYVQAQDTDFGYSKVKASVGYHLYRPTSLPSNLEIASKFSLSKNMADKPNTVQIAFDIPVTEMMKGTKTKTIVMRQVGPATKEDLNAYIGSTVYESYPAPQTTTVPTAEGQIAYIFSKKLGDGIMNNMLFLTKDGVLIELISPKVSTEELIQIANGLE